MNRTTFRKLTVAAVIAAATIVPLTACQSTPQVSQAADVATPAPAPVASAKDTVDDTTDRAFLKVIGQHGLPQTQKSIDAAKSMCRALDRGADPEQVALIAYQGFDGDIDKAGALLGAGAAAYCPEHVDALTSIGATGA